LHNLSKIEVPATILEAPATTLQVPAEILEVPAEILEVPAEILKVLAQVPLCRILSRIVPNLIRIFDILDLS